MTRSRCMPLLVVVCTIGVSARPSAAPAEPPPLVAEVFSDNAVVQRDRPLRVYGHASPADTISVTFDSTTVQATPDASGAWSATLPPVQAGGPHTLMVRASSGAEQKASGILAGDVWLCSGQSNMELPVRRTLNADGEIAGSAHDSIRLLSVGHAFSAAPLDRFETPVSWKTAGPDTIGDFSGTCYYFARELQKTVKVPMGLVHASWGGSAIEPWIGAEGLRAIGGFDDHLDLLRAYARDPKAAVERLGREWEAWWRAQVPAQPGNEPWQPAASGEWRDAPARLGDWKRWGVPELVSHDGMVWFRRTVTLTGAQAAGSARLALGGIDEVDQTWVNGRPVGNTFGWGTPRTYELPPGALHEGANVIVVNVLSTWASGGLLGPADTMALQLQDGSAVPLGSGWTFRVVPTTVGSPPRAPWESVSGLTTLYNAMIAPLGPMALRGALWYQGESNASAADRYERLLSALIADWRGRFGADLPFLVVQLPNFGAPVTMPAESDWASLREAQRRAVEKDAHAGLAVTIDVGDPNELHPPNKQAVGARLARAARHVVYGEALTPSGPRPLRAERAGDRVVVTFGDIDGALVAYSAHQPIGFELCGETQESCRFASATIDGDRILVAAPGPEPVTRVRYCWGDAPLCNLYDRSRLPAGPFEIDVTRAGSSHERDDAEPETPIAGGNAGNLVHIVGPAVDRHRGM